MTYGSVDTTSGAQIFKYHGINESATELYYIMDTAHGYTSEHVLNKIVTPLDPPRTLWTNYDYIPN